MIEETLFNYGVLGCWTVSLLMWQYKHQSQMSNVVKQNTRALIEIKETIKKCKKTIKCS